MGTLDRQHHVETRRLKRTGQYLLGETATVRHEQVAVGHGRAMTVEDVDGCDWSGG
ncbi:hypothetical protein D3C75_1322950 [compost metagenome]